MYFQTYQRLTGCYFKRICTGLNRTLLNEQKRRQHQNLRAQRSLTLYITSIGVVVAGCAFAAVPLYRIFCQSYGYGGTVSTSHDRSKVNTMKPIKDREIKILFNADTATSMQWKFKPQQTEIKVVPGETALAFYTATNPTNSPIVGISTYNVVPFEAAQYFNKIQCFCFDEQFLKPHEQVDMPVFFYIDPDFNDDPMMERVNSITLSYTFFEATEGTEYVLPEYMKMIAKETQNNQADQNKVEKQK